MSIRWNNGDRRYLDGTGRYPVAGSVWPMLPVQITDGDDDDLTDILNDGETNVLVVDGLGSFRRPPNAILALLVGGATFDIDLTLQVSGGATVELAKTQSLGVIDAGAVTVTAGAAIESIQERYKLVERDYPSDHPTLSGTQPGGIRFPGWHTVAEDTVTGPPAGYLRAIFSVAWPHVGTQAESLPFVQYYAVADKWLVYSNLVEITASVDGCTVNGAASSTRDSTSVEICGAPYWFHISGGTLSGTIDVASWLPKYPPAA